MLRRIPGGKRMTAGADRRHDTAIVVDSCWFTNARPHVAQKKHSAIDGRMTRQESYKKGWRARKRIEEVFGWLKTVGGGRKPRYRGAMRNGAWFQLQVAACRGSTRVEIHLVRISRIVALPGPIEVTT